MNKLFFILLILIVCVYVKYNLKFTDKYEILQLDPSQLSYDILNERNPIVIQQGIKDTQDILPIFRYLHVHKTLTTLYDTQDTMKVKARFCVLFSSTPMEIDIINPKYTTSDYKAVTIKLHENQALILPIYWRFKISSPTQCMNVYDLYSLLYSSIL